MPTPGRERTTCAVQIAKPDASVEWQAERAMLAAHEAQVIYDGMGWTLRVGSVRLCDV